MVVKSMCPDIEVSPCHSGPSCNSHLPSRQESGFEEIQPRCQISSILLAQVLEHFCLFADRTCLPSFLLVPYDNVSWQPACPLLVTKKCDDDGRCRMCTVVDIARKRAGAAQKLRDQTGPPTLTHQETTRLLVLQKCDPSWVLGSAPEPVIDEEDEDASMVDRAQDLNIEKTPVATEK
jgi:hypothetical protein